MKYELKVYTIQHPGKRKDALGNPHQEDSIFPAHGAQMDSDRLFILCDGMGGHDAGEVASATVCESMSRNILESTENNEHFTTEDFQHALSAAYNDLDLQDNGAVKKMGTTMAFLKLHSAGALIAHIGDSRVYHIRPGSDGENTEILFVTHDHSLVNDLIKIGELTPEEARVSRQKNVITRAMQPNMERRCKADIYNTSDIRPGDFFYLCSDGMLEQPEMDDGSALKNIFSLEGGDDKEKVNILEAATAENRDNHTALIVHILEVEDDNEDIMPAAKDERPRIRQMQEHPGDYCAMKTPNVQRRNAMVNAKAPTPRAVKYSQSSNRNIKITMRRSEGFLDKLKRFFDNLF